MAAWLCFRRKRRSKSEAWTNAGTSLHDSTSPLPPQQSTAFQANGHQQHPQGVGIPYTNGSWSSNKQQMSEVEVRSIAQSLLNQRDGRLSQQDFNPWVDLAYQQQQQVPYQQQLPYDHPVYHPPFYSPRSLSTITEKSTPGTMNSNRLPLPVASSPASRPSAELSYYSPPSGTSGNGIQLPYVSDLPRGAANAANPHQWSPQSSFPWFFLINANASNVLFGKLRVMIACQNEASVTFWNHHFGAVCFHLLCVEERSRCEEHKSKELHVDLWGYFYI